MNESTAACASGMQMSDAARFVSRSACSSGSSRRRAVTEFDDSLYKIDDTIALGIMPYGLAANLLVDENPSAASFYQARYEERLREKARRVRASVEDIEDIYGGIGHGWFSSWG